MTFPKYLPIKLNSYMHTVIKTFKKFKQIISKYER